MKTVERRVCRQCLLRELAGADEAGKKELLMIEKYRDALKPADRVAGEEYERRLLLCKECGCLLDGTCAACGCYVELRAAARRLRCPKKKW